MERGDMIEADVPAERPGPRVASAPDGAAHAADRAPSPDASLRLSDLAATPSFPRIVLAVGGLALLSAAMFAVIHAIGVERIRSTVEAAGPWGPLVYIVLKVATMVIAPLSSAPLRMSAGAIFGFWEGVLLTVLGGVLGGSANFWISRLIGRRLVARCVGASGMDAVDRLVGRLRGRRAVRVPPRVPPPARRLLHLPCRLPPHPLP